jgi:hypothetical protein
MWIVPDSAALIIEAYHQVQLHQQIYNYEAHPEDQLARIANSQSHPGSRATTP